MTAETTGESGSNRAVSPVIGVILMVAITVILAAVIGAFVLEIGDQQETAPNTSFDSSQEVTYMHTGGGDAGNYTVVSLSHAGGNVVDIRNVELKYKGNTSLWAASSIDGTDIELAPQPDIRRALGTNEQVEFTSGESWHPFAHSGWNHDNVAAGCTYKLNVAMGGNVPTPRIETNGGACDHTATDWKGATVTHYNAQPMYTTDGPDHQNDEPGETVSIVWKSSSGGKTQTLFKYTVQ